MGLTTLDLKVRIAAKKAVAKVQHKLEAERDAIKAQRAELKAELNGTTIAPAQ